MEIIHLSCGSLLLWLLGWQQLQWPSFLTGRGTPARDELLVFCLFRTQWTDGRARIHSGDLKPSYQELCIPFATPHQRCDSGFLVTNIQAVVAFNDNFLRKGISGFLWKMGPSLLRKADDRFSQVEQLGQSKEEACKSLEMLEPPDCQEQNKMLRGAAGRLRGRSQKVP